MKKSWQTKLSIIVALLFTGVLINSCIPTKTEHFDLKSIQANLLRITGIENDEYNDIFLVEEISEDVNVAEIRFDSIGIKIDNEMNAYLANIQRKNFDIISSAYAFSPAVYYERILEITIVSDKDYNSVFTAGKDLTPIINFHCNYSIYGRSLYPFLENFDIYNSVFMRFVMAPDTEEIHNLTIKYNTDKNNGFETKINNLKILK